MANSETGGSDRSVRGRLSLVVFAGLAAASLVWTLWVYNALGHWLTYTGNENWGGLGAIIFGVPSVPVQAAMAVMGVFVIIRKRRDRLRWVYATASAVHMAAFLAMFYLTYKLLPL